MQKLLLFFVLFFLFFSQTVFSKENFKLQKIASDLGIVWGMTFIGQNRILATNKEGKFFIVNTATKKIEFLEHSLKIKVKGQGGLLDVKVSPNFKTDKKIYFTYVKEEKSKGVTTLATAKLIGNKLTNFKDLIVTKSASNTSVHFGSRITFDDEGHLFFTVGDRGIRENAQKLNTHAGKVIRLNLDGSVPIDNPFVNEKGVLSEIYSFGHRNPQGIFFDKTNKKLWLIEHGPRGGDEINLIKKGLNYGWPVISYGKEYWSTMPVGEGTHKVGMQQPKKVYIPSIAPSSIIVYDGDEFKTLKGKLLAGALKLQHLNVLTLNNYGEIIEEKRYLKNLGERIRNIIQSPKGLLYISTDNGNIYELKAKK